MATKIAKHTIVGLKELRNNMEKYIQRVNHGEHFTIVRRSKPIFQLSPVDKWGDTVGEWEPVVDFRDAKGRGMRVREFVTLVQDAPKGKKYKKTQPRRTKKNI